MKAGCGAARGRSGAGRAGPAGACLLFLMFILAALTVGRPAVAHAAGAPAPPVGPEPVLWLTEEPQGQEAWPYLRAWRDHEGRTGIDEVLRRPGIFVPPDVPRHSFGPARGALWLRLALQVRPGDREPWVLAIDYAELHDIDYYLVQDGRVIEHQVLGQNVVFARRAMPVSRHAVRLAAAPGGRYEVLLRVRTVGELVVPLRLLREPQLQAREDRLQLSMGLMSGTLLALLAYCALYGLYLREPLFLLYAVQLSALSGYLAASRGVLAEYVWPDDAWWSVNGPAFLLAIALAAASGFIDRVLQVATLRRWCSVMLRLVAAAGLAMAGLLWLGWVDLAFMNDAFSLLGAMPAVLGAYCSWLRWRQGDRVAGWIFIERVAQSCGVLTMSAIVQGLLPATPFTLDLFLWTCTLEMIIWVWALGTRARMLIDAEQRARADQARLQPLAHSDPLTGLLNRRGMNEALQRALAGAAPQRLLAVYLLDLDGFKAVNDTHGHAAGDALLVAVAQRLRACLRQGDVVARLGGDEFVVAAADLPQAAAAVRVGRVLQQQFEAPFTCGPVECRLGVTIGYALAPEDGTDVAGLLSVADQAMYAGKRRVTGASEGAAGMIVGDHGPAAGPAPRPQRGRLAEQLSTGSALPGPAPAPWPPGVVR